MFTIQHTHNSCQTPYAALSSKRDCPIDSTSESGSETQVSPKHNMNTQNIAPYTHAPVSSHSVTRMNPVTALTLQLVTSLTTHPVTVATPVPPAFVPRSEYVMLMFQENVSKETKLCWLRDVTNAFHLDRTLAEVKMAAVTSRYVYITRNREDIIDKATKGEFLALSLQVQHSPTRPRKFPSYVNTRYPVDVQPNLAKEQSFLCTPISTKWCTN